MEITVTKREIIASIAIVCAMVLFGVLISGTISNAIMDKQQEYETALQINGDMQLFEYGMRTNVGNAFVYGTLKALDPVTYEEIGGSYSYVKKVTERYTKHERTVTKSDGEKSWTETEEYYTWDEIDSESKFSTRISFLDVEFAYGAISFPASYKISTIKQTSKIRHVYYGAPAESTGTLYASLKDNNIVDTKFYPGWEIGRTIDYLTSDAILVIFWVFWVMLVGGVVCLFYFIDNRWLEDSNGN